MILFNLIIPNINMIGYKFSNITLKVKGPGFSNITSSYFNMSYYPDIIYINGIKETTISNIYDFGKINNSVILIWNNAIGDCYRMFRGCSNVTEIDLSNFDTSKVTNMGYMFAYCSQLTSLDLSNFITSNVTNMGCMFDGCSQLSFLDLSNFETSK